MFCAALPITTSPEFLAFKAVKGLKRPMKPGVSHKPPQDRRHEELLAATGRQDRAAFVELFEYYAPRVKSYLLKHGADDATAEEIVQATFVTVWEKAKSFNPQKAAASTWIFTIARNKRIDMLRKQKYIDINTDAPELENAAAPEKDAYAGQDEVDRLHVAIDTLPREQAELLRMSFFEDKSHQAISKETHLPLGTVKSRLRLALEKLRHVMMKGDAA